MKSLQESLFDKDLINKNISFRNVYELASGNTAITYANYSTTFSITSLFDKDKVKTYKNPYKTDHLQGFVKGILGIIGDCRVPTEEELKTKDLTLFKFPVAAEWCKMVKKELRKYIKPQYATTFDQFFIIKFYDFNYFTKDKHFVTVELNLNNGKNILRFLFNKTLDK